MHKGFCVAVQGETQNSPLSSYRHPDLEFVYPRECGLPMIWACNAEKHPKFAFRGGACMCVGVKRTLWKLRHTTPSWTESKQALLGCTHARRGPTRCGGSHSLAGVDALGWWPRPACRANGPPRSKSLLRSQNNLGGGSGSPTPACPGWMDPTRLHVVAVLWRRSNVCQSNLHVAAVLLHVDQADVESAREIEQQARKGVVRVAVDRIHSFPSWGRGKESILAAMDCC